MTTDLRYKGMTVCYCELVALKKITGVLSPKELNQYGVDTSIVNFYLDWAIKNKYIKDKKDVDIFYDK